MEVIRTKAKSKGPSRIIIYTLVGAVAVYAYFLNTTPPASTTHHTNHFGKMTTSTLDNGITPEDLTAHFARYSESAKDPFIPSIDLHPGQAPGVPGSGGGEWSLTGVNTIDGVTTATVENPASSDSVFLKVGDNWNGLRVREVNSDNVVFENALGQETRLSFPGNDADNDSAAETTSSGKLPPSTVPTVTPLPSITIVPMQVPAPPGGGGNSGPADQGNVADTGNNGNGQ